MEDFVLLGGFAAIIILGYFVMARVDLFLEKVRRQNAEQGRIHPLNIATSSFNAIPSVINILNDMEARYPDVQYNAIKYTPPGSQIDIGWKRQGRFIYISIGDNGPGIPDQAKPHIFDMFYSASNRIADSRRSMGLGLALCKSIINAHGGEITVEDNVPHGSIFTFSVPAGEVELHE